MPPISTHLVALFVLCLTLVVPAQANACPAGEKQVCLDGCICLPAGSDTVESWVTK